MSEMGNSAFGFAFGWRDNKKTLSFSLVREVAKEGNAAEPKAITIRCPCTVCGHLNNATIGSWDANTSESGPTGQLRVECEECHAGLVVRVTKRDPRLSI